MVLFEKFGHQPLNRQAERYAKEGVPISLSTLADQVGGCTTALMPLFKRLEACVLSAERLHGDDTRVPVLAKGKTDTGRIAELPVQRLDDLLPWNWHTSSAQATQAA
jgi:transposase